MTRGPETILIPSQREGVAAEAVPISRVLGDISTGISQELTGLEGFIKLVEKGPEITDVLEKGGRVFLTEGDDFLLVNPEPKPRQS